MIRAYAWDKNSINPFQFISPFNVGSRSDLWSSINWFIESAVRDDYYKLQVPYGKL